MPPYSFRNVWTSFLNRQFAPSAATLNDWVSTRKNPQMTFPGLFHTHNPEFDTKMYWTAFALEIAGAMPIVFGAYLFFDGALFYPIIFLLGALLSFFLDLRISIFLRRNDLQKRLDIVQLKIQTILGLTPANIQLLKSQIGNRNKKIIDVLLTVALGLIALLKTVSFAYFFYGAWGIIIPVGFMYFFIAYVHIYHSGYKVKVDRFRKSLINDYDTWVKNGGSAGAPITMNFAFVHAGNNYNLTYINFLQDTDGLQLANQQSSVNFSVMRDYGLAAQLQQLTGMSVNTQNGIGGTPLNPASALQGSTQVAQV